MKRKIILVLLLLIAVRLFAFIVTDRINNDEFWEYGSIAENIINDKGYSLFYFQDSILEYKYNSKVNPFPSAYMPPVYPIILTPIFAIDSNQIRNFLILIINIIFDVLTAIYLFKFCLTIFSEKIGFFSIIILAILPEFIYSSTLLGTTSLYHFLSIIILFLIANYLETSNFKYLLYIAILFGIFINFRSESIIFLFLAIIFLIWKKKSYKLLILLIIPIILLLPFQIRNYFVFDKFIPLTTSGGLNLYRGNNPDKIGSWGDNEIFNYRNSLKNKPDYEVRLNDYYLKKSLDFVIKNPLKVIKNSFVKAYHLWIFNFDDLRSYNLIYILQNSILMLLIMFSVFKLDHRKFEILFVFLLYSTITAMIFFALPRYQTMMKIALIPFVSKAIQDILNLMKQKLD